MNDVSKLMISETERKHRLIMDNSADMISVHSMDGRISFISTSCEKITGYAQLELVGENIFKFAHPDDFKNIDNRIEKNEASEPIQFRFKRKDGDYVWLEISIRVSQSKLSQKFAEIVCVSRDISKRKNAEFQAIEAEKRLLYAQSIAQVGNWEIDLESQEVKASPEAQRIYGFDKLDRKITLSDVKKIALPCYREHLNNALIMLIKGESEYAEEFGIFRKADSQVRMIFSRAEVQKNETGEPIKILGVIRDITEIKSAQEALLESEIRHKTMIANISDVISIINEEGIVTYISPNCEKWFGWKIENLELKNVWQIIHSNDRKRIQNEFRNLLKRPGSTRTVDFRHECMDGTYKLVRLTATNMVDNQSINGILMNYHDVTEHKKILKALIENEERYRGVFSAVSEGLFVIDIESNRIIDMNDSAKEMYGYSSEEFSKLDFKVVFSDVKNQVRKDGSVFPVEISTSIFVLEEKKMLLIIVKDLSFEMKNENEIVEANRLLNESQKFAHIGSYSYNLKNDVWTASSELMRIFGIDNKYTCDLKGWMELISAKDRERMNNYYKFLIETKGDFDNKYRVNMQNTGEEIWVHGLGVFEYNSEGNIENLIGTIQDITEKVSYEDKLQESISLLKTTLESTANGILVVGNSGKITYFNNIFVEMWGLSAGEIEFINDEELLELIKHKVRNKEYFQEVLKEIYYNPESRTSDEIELVDGRTFERFSIPQLLGNENVGRVWSYRDITERINFEAKLKESEEHFRSVIEYSQDAFYRRNIENENFDYVSPVFQKLTGYSSSEMKRMNRKQVTGKIHQEDLPLVQKYFNVSGFVEDKSVILEYRFLCKDGSYRWFGDKFVYKKDKDDTYIYGSIHDISERKHYEEKIIYNSYHDSLTGLYNRRYLDEQLFKFDIPENYPISIIVGDMNGLKLANDTFGHNVGDEILVKCSEIISNTCRKDDLVARWGGDEFLVVLLKTSFEETNDIAREINENCAKVMIHSIPVSISLGFDTKNDVTQRLMSVLKTAEDSMYKHKMVETTSVRGKTIDVMLNTLYEKTFVKSNIHAE
ncbi:MAG: PAS domain S-box protein [Bacillota bacterium]